MKEKHFGCVQPCCRKKENKSFVERKLVFCGVLQIICGQFGSLSLLNVLFGELPQVLCIQNIMNNVIGSFLDSSSFATSSCGSTIPSGGTTSTPWTTRPHALSLLRRTTLHRGIEGRSDRRNHEHRSRSKAGNRGRSTSRCSKSKTPSSSISSAPGFPIRPPSVPQLVQSHESHSGVLPAARRQSFDACLFGYDAM